MIMIEKPGTREILVQNKIESEWPGIIFPGGHVESAYREAFEVMASAITISVKKLMIIRTYRFRSE